MIIAATGLRIPPGLGPVRQNAALKGYWRRNGAAGTGGRKWSLFPPQISRKLNRRQWLPLLLIRPGMESKRSLCGSRPGRPSLAVMKLRNPLSVSVPSVLRLRSALPNPFRKSRFICGRNRRRSRPGKVSGRTFVSMGIQLCWTWNLWFLTRDRPALSSRRFARSSAAEHPLLPAKDKGLPIYSHGSRKHFLRRKRRSRKPPSASKLRLSKRRKFASVSTQPPRQNRPPRHKPKAGVSSSKSRAARKLCGGRSCGAPRQRRRRRAAEGLLRKMILQRSLLSFRRMRFNRLLCHRKAGRLQALSALGQRGPPSGL